MVRCSYPSSHHWIHKSIGFGISQAWIHTVENPSFPSFRVTFQDPQRFPFHLLMFKKAMYYIANTMTLKIQYIVSSCNKISQCSRSRNKMRPCCTPQDQVVGCEGARIWLFMHQIATSCWCLGEFGENYSKLKSRWHSPYIYWFTRTLLLTYLLVSASHLFRP